MTVSCQEEKSRRSDSIPVLNLGLLFLLKPAKMYFFKTYATMRMPPPTMKVWRTRVRRESTSMTATTSTNASLAAPTWTGGVSRVSVIV